MMRAKRLRARTAALLLCLAQLCHAQAPGRARLEGTVLDVQGAAISGATVTLSDSAHGLSREQRADARGHFAFDLLPSADYSLRVERQGFQTRVYGPFHL